MSEPNVSSARDGVQIMPGEYTIHQDKLLVGQLFVEETTTPGRTLEHWLLHKGYRWPSPTNPSQEMRFEYAGAPRKLQEFLASGPPDVTYVLADCKKQVQRQA